MIDTLTFIVIVVLYMAGGQTGFHKIMRRLGVPLSAYISTIKDKKTATRNSILLLLYPILSMGYGKNSKIMSIFKLEWLVRLVYSTLVFIPFLIVRALDGQFLSINTLLGYILLIIAYQLRLGGFKITDKVDFLYEDLARGSAIAINVLLI